MPRPRAQGVLTVHEALEALDEALARLALELVGLLRLLHDGLHVLLGVVDDLGHVGHGLGVRLRVADADGEAAVQQPVVDHLLAVVDEVARHLRAHVVHNDVQQALHLVAQLVLGHDAHEVLALHDEHAVVARPAVGLARVELAVLVVHVGREARDGLLARPQRVVLAGAPRHGPHDGRRRDAPVPALHPQQHVEEDVLLDEDVALRHLARAQQRVLHDAHDGPVRGGRHDEARHGHELLRLGDGRQRLQRVHVHLVAVKVRVVGRRAREVQAEGAVV